MGLPALQMAQNPELGQMTTLGHERNYGDLENPMTTAINPGCTCGAHNFGPGAAHLENCYISLAKEAEAVQGVPVQQVGSNPVNPPAPADDLYAPAPVNQTITLPSANVPVEPPARKRTAVPLPPAPEMEYTHIEWVEGLATQITEVYASGVPAMIKTGTMTGKLTNIRPHDGKNGLMHFGDITIEWPGTELDGIGASFSVPTVLKALLDTVPLDSSVEIIRKGKIGKAFGFEVYLLD